MIFTDVSIKYLTLKLNYMNEQEVIEKICDRLVTVLYNELDYYMFEELGYTETDDKYVEDADKLISKVINTLVK